MNVGDLVFEIPFGKAWFKHNPYLSNSIIGIVTEIIDHEFVFVMWGNNEEAGKIDMMAIDYLVKCNESR